MTERQPANHEQPMSPEAQKPQYDAILVHGYWMSEHRTGLGLRSRLTARAAALAYDQGKGAEKIVVDLGQLWGPDYPSEGKLIADELETKYHVPHEAIIIKEDAFSTGGEVKSFVGLAKQNGWTNLLDVAFARHQGVIGHRFGTIPLIYKRNKTEGINVTYASVENLLKNDPNPHVKRLAEDLTWSNYALVYAGYEGIKWLVMHKPGFNYETLEEKNKATRTSPGEDSPLPFRFDVYKIPPKKESK